MLEDSITEKPFRFETPPDVDGIRTVVEYEERDGKIYKITRRIRVRKVGFAAHRGVPLHAPSTLRPLQSSIDDPDASTSAEEPRSVLSPMRISSDDLNAWRGTQSAEDAFFEASVRIDEELQGVQRGSTETVDALLAARYEMPQLAGSDSVHKDDFILLVTNLSDDVREGDLWELFGYFGNIRKVELASHTYLVGQEPTAFVTFASRTDAQRAVEWLNGQPYANLTLKVDWAGT